MHLEMKLFSIRDNAVEGYSPAQCIESTGLAVRQFTEAVNNPESPYGKHPADYILFEIGTFDTETGLPAPLENGHVNLGNGVDFLETDN